MRLHSDTVCWEEDYRNDARLACTKHTLTWAGTFHLWISEDPSELEGVCSCSRFLSLHSTCTNFSSKFSTLLFVFFTSDRISNNWVCTLSPEMRLRMGREGSLLVPVENLCGQSGVTLVALRSGTPSNVRRRGVYRTVLFRRLRTTMAVFTVLCKNIWAVVTHITSTVTVKASNVFFSCISEAHQIKHKSTPLPSICRLTSVKMVKSPDESTKTED